MYEFGNSTGSTFTRKVSMYFSLGAFLTLLYVVLWVYASI